MHKSKCTEFILMLNEKAEKTIEEILSFLVS